MKQSMEIITDAEWEIMRVVWALGETTSSEIIEVLENKMDWKPSTVKTLLSRLVTKHYLETRKEGKQFIYYALVEEEIAVNGAQKELFDKICHRKIGGLLIQAMTDHDLSKADIEIMESILAKKKKTAPEEVPCNCLKGQCRCQG